MSRTRLLATFAVVVVSAVVPLAASARNGGLRADFPGTAVLIDVADPDASVARVAAAPVVEERLEAPAVRPSSSSAPRPAAKDVVTVPDVPKAGELVRGWHVMHTTTEAEDIFDTSCTKASECDAHQLRPPRWPTDDTGKVTINYAFNDSGRRNLRASAGLLESAFRASAAEWSKWNSNIIFAGGAASTAAFGADGKDGSCDDGTNVVTWGQFDSNVIGAAIVCYDKTGRFIRDADLALNVTHHWENIAGEAESRHSYDIRSIVTHELGHWLSLLDLYSSDGSVQTMFGSAQYGEANKRTLARGDIIGVQTAYPCGSGDSCPRSGIVDD